MDIFINFLLDFTAQYVYFLFSISAFHILKDTTIQFTLEKVPAVEDTQFSFQSFDGSYHSTGLLRVEGKFVNAVQVRNSKKYNRPVLLRSSHFHGIFSCFPLLFFFLLGFSL